MGISLFWDIPIYETWSHQSYHIYFDLGGMSLWRPSTVPWESNCDSALNRNKVKVVRSFTWIERSNMGQCIKDVDSYAGILADQTLGRAAQWFRNQIQSHEAIRWQDPKALMAIQITGSWVAPASLPMEKASFMLAPPGGKTSHTSCFAAGWIQLWLFQGDHHPSWKATSYPPTETHLAHPPWL